jgi:hypothetical protein
MEIPKAKDLIGRPNQVDIELAGMLARKRSRRVTLHQAW